MALQPRPSPVHVSLVADARLPEMTTGTGAKAVADSAAGGDDTGGGGAGDYYCYRMPQAHHLPHPPLPLHSVAGVVVAVSARVANGRS